MKTRQRNPHTWVLVLLLGGLGLLGLAAGVPAGAGATVLDAGGTLFSIVWIEASDVLFGKPKKGFTLVRGRNGLIHRFGTSGVRVAGNLATGNGLNGFGFGGAGDVVMGNLATG